ncbi:hypothetical protein Q5O24_06355 [Eubacteriaceae bacterium ES3]|nr:hypothetical protein Q5O24_06355 [Eubacteriaceae bacterium ES3]
MKNFRKISLMFLLFLFISPNLFAAEDPASTEISISDSPSPVTFTDSEEDLDQEVYEALCIVVIDQNSNKIDFTKEDIQLTYNREIGNQSVKVDYLGNDNYAPSSATGTVSITEPTKQNSQLVLIANPPAVSFSTDNATLDAAVLKALSVQVVDEKYDKIDFSDDQIKLEYTRNVGNQTVQVTYSGNDQYNGSSASSVVSITPLVKTRVILNLNTPSVNYTNNSSALDVSVFQALSVQIVTQDNIAVDFTTNDIQLSYNRETGTQDVTVKYIGNSLYFPSQATANVQIVGQAPNPQPEKTNTVINLTMPKSTLALNEDPDTMTSEVYNAINVQVVDNTGNNIVFTPSEIDLSFNHASGDQVVTVRYIGNDRYNASQSNVTVTIIDPQPTYLVFSAHTIEVPYDKNSQLLDESIIDALNLNLVDSENNPIDFQQSEITLNYDREKGAQEVTVRFVGNDQYQSATATAEVYIADEYTLGISTTTMIIIIVSVIIVLSIIGVLVYRKRAKAN